jgi:hypothetical protein
MQTQCVAWRPGAEREALLRDRPADASVPCRADTCDHAWRSVITAGLVLGFASDPRQRVSLIAPMALVDDDQQAARQEAQPLLQHHSRDGGSVSGGRLGAALKQQVGLTDRWDACPDEQGVLQVRGGGAVECWVCTQGGDFAANERPFQVGRRVDRPHWQEHTD